MFVLGTYFLTIVIKQKVMNFSITIYNKTLVVIYIFETDPSTGVLNIPR